MRLTASTRKFRYRKYLYIGLALLALPGSASHAAAAEIDFSDMNASLADRFVIPGYTGLSEKMSALSTVTRHYCAAPSDDNLQKTRRAYADAMTAWQHIRIIVFGPITENARAARIQFWPDKRGTAARQIRRAVVRQDQTLLRPGGLAGKSVALQSLSAYEHLLTTSPDKPFSCGLMEAISDFQTTIARALLQEWKSPDGFRDTVLSAGKGNRQFTNTASPAALYLKSIAVMLDIVIRQKLEAPLGKDINHASPRSAENWRTGMSRQNIATNLDAIAEMFETPSGFSAALSNKNGKALGDAIVRLLRNAAAKTRKLPLPLSDAVADSAVRPVVEEIAQDLKNIRILIRESVVNTLNLPIGFNSLDGD